VAGHLLRVRSELEERPVCRRGKGRSRPVRAWGAYFTVYQAVAPNPPSKAGCRQHCAGAGRGIGCGLWPGPDRGSTRRWRCRAVPCRSALSCGRGRVPRGRARRSATAGSITR